MAKKFPATSPTWNIRFFSEMTVWSEGLQKIVVGPVLLYWAALRLCVEATFLVARDMAWMSSPGSLLFFPPVHVFNESRAWAVSAFPVRHEPTVVGIFLIPAFSAKRFSFFSGYSLLFWKNQTPALSASSSQLEAIFLAGFPPLWPHLGGRARPQCPPSSPVASPCGWVSSGGAPDGSAC